MAIDVTISMILRILLAYIFLHAVRHKAADLQQFIVQLDAYDLLPQRLLRGVAGLLLVTESVLALTLPIPGLWLSPVIAAVLLGVYALALAINLLRGEEDLDCGCSGAADFPQGISWALVGRNTSLVLVAITAAMPLTQRAISLHDGATIVLASAATVLLYNSIGQAITNQQRQAMFDAAHTPTTRARP